MGAFSQTVRNQDVVLVPRLCRIVQAPRCRALWRRSEARRTARVAVSSAGAGPLGPDLRGMRLHSLRPDEGREHAKDRPGGPCRSLRNRDRRYSLNIVAQRATVDGSPEESAPCDAVKNSTTL